MCAGELATIDKGDERKEKTGNDTEGNLTHPEQNDNGSTAGDRKRTTGAEQIAQIT